MYNSTKTTADLEYDESSYSQSKDSIKNFNEIINMEDTMSDDDYDFVDDLQTNSHDGIHFQIISLTKISIEFVPSEILNENIIKILKEHKATFDIETNLYLISFNEYDSVVKKFNNLKNKVYIKKIPNFVLSLFNKYNDIDYNIIKYKEKIDENEYKTITIDYTDDFNNPKKISDLPKDLIDYLYDYQKEGVIFGLKKNGRCLIADEMGIGKTIQALCIAKLYKENWPVLIICPGSVKYCWKSEIHERLLIDNNRIQIINSSKIKIKKNNIDFYIISYDLFRNMGKIIKKLKFNFYILDESHCIKSPVAKRSKEIIPLVKKAKRVLLLTGTPLLNIPMEAYTTLEILNPQYFNNFRRFGRRFCDPKLTPFGYKWSGTSNTKELHAIFELFMIRRLKKDVLSHLPAKTRTKVKIDCDEKIIKKMGLKEFDIQTLSKNKKGISRMEMYVETGYAKLPGIKEYVNDLLESQVKFLLFAHHVKVLDEIEKFIKKKKYKYIRIDGSTKPENRFKQSNNFQKDENIKVALLSITSCGTGITLTAANVCVFAELIWTPSLMIQAEDRIHRIGQNHDSVDIRYLYGEHTIDDYILEILSKKKIFVSTTLDNIRNGYDFEKIENKSKVKNEIENDDKNNKKDENETINDSEYYENLKFLESILKSTKIRKRNALLPLNEQNLENKKIENKENENKKIENKENENKKIKNKENENKENENKENLNILNENKNLYNIKEDFNENSTDKKINNKNLNNQLKNKFDFQNENLHPQFMKIRKHF
jgi:SNF2 family DNA or RNA helicase